MRENFRKHDLENFKIKLRETKKNANKQNHTLQQLEIGSGLIETNPDGLIPSSFETKIVKKYYEVFKRECKATSTTVLGIRQYKHCLLKTIKHFLQLTSISIVQNSDFEISDSLPKSEVDEKVSKAIVLYNQFKTDIKRNITYG